MRAKSHANHTPSSFYLSTKASTASLECQWPRGKPLSVDCSNRCRVAICPQSAQWLHQAKSEQPASLSIRLLNPRLDSTKCPEPVCFLRSAWLGPRPSARAATAPSPARPTPWHARKLRSSLEPSLPIPLPQENCLPYIPRAPCNLGNNQFRRRPHCPKSPL